MNGEKVGKLSLGTIAIKQYQNTFQSGIRILGFYLNSDWGRDVQK